MVPVSRTVLETKSLKKSKLTYFRHSTSVWLKLKKISVESFHQFYLNQLLQQDFKWSDQEIKYLSIQQNLQRMDLVLYNIFKYLSTLCQIQPSNKTNATIKKYCYFCNSSYLGLASRALNPRQGEK